MNVLEWLIEWYKSNCNGDWEHRYGVTIDTLDNPGWTIRIDLFDTELDNIDFDTIDVFNDENDWILCRVKDNVFYGNGDPDKLLKILEIFKSWQEVHDEEN